jgi:hypothetical protein
MALGAWWIPWRQKKRSRERTSPWLRVFVQQVTPRLGRVADQRFGESRISRSNSTSSGGAAAPAGVRMRL